MNNMRKMITAVMVFIAISIFGAGDVLAIGTGGSTGDTQATNKMLWPVSGGEVLSHYGKRVHPITGQVHNHAGTDVAVARGTPIYSPYEGKVTAAGYEGGCGKSVTIQHTNGYSTRYCHMDAYKVGVGDVVSRGQQIGKVGMTGNTTGPHLHYEMYKGGQLIDAESVAHEGFNGGAANPNSYNNATADDHDHEHEGAGSPLSAFSINNPAFSKLSGTPADAVSASHFDPIVQESIKWGGQWRKWVLVLAALGLLAVGAGAFFGKLSIGRAATLCAALLVIVVVNRLMGAFNITATDNKSIQWSQGTLQ